MDKTAIILIVILTLPWTGVLIYILTKKSRAYKYYRKLQEKYELRTEHSGKQSPIFSGVYRTRQLKIENSVNGNKKLCTKLTVGCKNPANFEFTLVKRNKSNSSVYSKGSFLLEDNEFDDKFIIHTNDLERVKRLFDFNTRFKLQQVNDLGFKGEIMLRGGSFTYIEPGLVNSDMAVMKLELVLHELCDLADVMKYN